MITFGSTCPMCCGDLDDVAYLGTGAAVCLSCGWNVKAPAFMPSTVRWPDAVALSVSDIAMGDHVMTRTSADAQMDPGDARGQVSRRRNYE